MKSPFKRFSALKIPPATDNPKADYAAMEAVIKTDRFSRLNDEDSKPYLEVLAERFTKLSPNDRQEKMEGLPDIAASFSETQKGLFTTAVAKQANTMAMGGRLKEVEKNAIVLDASALTPDLLQKRYNDSPALRAIQETQEEYKQGITKFKKDISDKTADLFGDKSLDDTQRTKQLNAFKNQEATTLLDNVVGGLSKKLNGTEHDALIERKLTAFRESVYQQGTANDVGLTPLFFAKTMPEMEGKHPLGNPTKAKADYVVIQQNAALDRYFDGINNGVVAPDVAGKGTVEQNFTMKITGDMDTLALVNFNDKKTPSEKTQANQDIVKSSTAFLEQEPYITDAILKRADEKITDPQKREAFKQNFSDEMNALNGTVGNYQAKASERLNKLQNAPSVSPSPTVTNTPEKTEKEQEATPPELPPRPEATLNTTKQTTETTLKKQVPPVPSRQGRRSLKEETPPELPPQEPEKAPQETNEEQPLAPPKLPPRPQTTGVGAKETVTGTPQQTQEPKKEQEAELDVKKRFFAKNLTYTVEKEDNGQKVKATLTTPRNTPYDINATGGAFTLADKGDKENKLVVTPTKDKLTFDASEFKGLGKDSPQQVVDKATGKKATFTFDKEGNVKDFKADEGFSHNIDIKTYDEKTHEHKTHSLNLDTGKLQETQDKTTAQSKALLQGVDMKEMEKAARTLQQKGMSKGEHTTTSPTHATTSPTAQQEPKAKSHGL